MRRREFITLLGGALAAPCVPHPLAAQPAGKIPRVGYLAAIAVAPRDEAFRQRLQELGHVEGQSVVIEQRFAEGKFEQLPALAAELVRLDVNVIVTVVTQASLAAKHATRTIPIVFIAVSDPLGSGLIASLARPGGNATGTSGMSSEVVGKSLELLKQATPAVARIAVMWNPENAVFQGQMLRETQLAAGRLGVELRIFAVRGPEEFEPALAGIGSAGAGALLVLTDPAYVAHAARLADLANERRLPTMYSGREYATAGGLMAYGTSFVPLFRRSADYVDKILKGAKPADLAVEQPTKFEFIINLKTARTLGIDLSAQLLALADEVIE
jgi:putative ABC transport system substrate-binding protein